VVLNPHAVARAGASARRRIEEALRPGRCDGGLVETRADGGNVQRIADWARTTRAELVVVAGGDGTVGDAVSALMLLEPVERPALAILPFGTANNVARSLGLRSIHAGDPAALDFAVRAAVDGGLRPFDVGRVGGRHFAGSFAVGMDADILRLRNATRAVLGEWPPFTGYPLYLASCAANLALRHGGRARLVVDGAPEEPADVYCGLVLNVSLYAGEFRFAAGDPSNDGRLDLHVFGGAADYVQSYVAAWRRHLAASRGEPVETPGSARSAHSVRAEFDRPISVQVDGEELPASAAWQIDVVPAALRVRVP
jgi:diacylglycerol kinase family enzyme